MKRVKSLLLVGLFFGALGLSAGPSLAQSNEPLKIGFVSLDRILSEAAPAKKALQKLEKEFQGRIADLQKIGKQAKDLQAVLEKEGVTLSENDRKGKEADLARLNRDLQRMQREIREDENMRRNEELSQVIERANKVVKQIAETEKYDLILQDAVYRSPRIDITDKVLKLLVDK